MTGGGKSTPLHTPSGIVHVLGESPPQLWSTMARYGRTRNFGAGFPAENLFKMAFFISPMCLLHRGSVENNRT